MLHHTPSAFLCFATNADHRRYEEHSSSMLRCTLACALSAGAAANGQAQYAVVCHGLPEEGGQSLFLFTGVGVAAKAMLPVTQVRNRVMCMRARNM